MALPSKKKQERRQTTVRHAVMYKITAYFILTSNNIKMLHTPINNCYLGIFIDNNFLRSVESLRHPSVHCYLMSRGEHILIKDRNSFNIPIMISWTWSTIAEKNIFEASRHAKTLGWWFVLYMFQRKKIINSWCHCFDRSTLRKNFTFKIRPNEWKKIKSPPSVSDVWLKFI